MLNVKGGNFVPGADGARPAAAALFRHAFFAETGGVQAHIDVPKRLRGAGVTATSLIVPEELLSAVGAKGRNAMLYEQAVLLAAGGGALGEALEDAEGEEKDDEA